jgi:hypothetical protein
MASGSREVPNAGEPVGQPGAFVGINPRLTFSSELTVCVWEKSRLE